MEQETNKSTQIHQNQVGNLRETCGAPAGNLRGTCGGPAGNLRGSHPERFLIKFYRFAYKEPKNAHFPLFLHMFVTWLVVACNHDFQIIGDKTYVINRLITCLEHSSYLPLHCFFTKESKDIQDHPFGCTLNMFPYWSCFPAFHT